MSLPVGGSGGGTPASTMSVILELVGGKGSASFAALNYDPIRTHVCACAELCTIFHHIFPFNQTIHLFPENTHGTCLINFPTIQRYISSGNVFFFHFFFCPRKRENVSGTCVYLCGSALKTHSYVIDLARIHAELDPIYKHRGRRRK